jgi:hypothetical protein
MNPNWKPFEAPIDQILAQYPQPLEALHQRQTPALVLRNAYNRDHCAGLMQRFAERGYFDRATVDAESQLSGGPYLDLGTSLGRVGSNPEQFFAHATATHELFSHLFDGFDDPVQTMYSALQDLAPNKKVCNAYEPDGRHYGPAIFRVYHAQEGHKPHYDSIARRSSKKSDYAVADFDHQFAGVLCLQKAGQEGETFIYDCYADDKVEDVLRQNEFPAYVDENQIARTLVQLEPGDLYFFSTENIHELPDTVGDTPRVVLAFFCAMSADRDEIFIWS